MTLTSHSWDAPAWAVVHAAAPGMNSLIATLRATRSICDAAIAVAPRTARLDPASGWQSADGLLALLEIECAVPALGELNVDLPPTLDAAAAAVDELLRRAADATLVASESLRGSGDTRQLLALASIMTGLSATYERVFGRSW